MGEVDVKSMSDTELMRYLDNLEKKARMRVVNGNVILDKVNAIDRQLSFRDNVDEEIKEKLENILSML